jgi:CRISPR-associated endonuclease/helicase Cas3
MNILLISQCDKRALTETRRILDQFGERRGDRTWQTPITQEGLETLHRLLRKTARKNTAVACHRIRGLDHTEMLWVVGDRSRFSESGAVPTNTTQRNVLRRADENDWHHGALIGLLVDLSALLHDVGKAIDAFQLRLTATSIGRNLIRHEWVSLRLFEAFVGDDDDSTWLARLSAPTADDDSLWLRRLRRDGLDGLFDSPFKTLCRAPLAQAVAWLVVTHHRLPVLPPMADGSKAQFQMSALRGLLTQVQPAWNEGAFIGADRSELRPYWTFRHGLPVTSEAWRKRASRIARQLSRMSSDAVCASVLDNPFVMHLSRLSLMLADHHYSRLSGPHPERVRLATNSPLLANTIDGAPNQSLDEHLIGVAQHGAEVARFLPGLERSLPTLAKHKRLKRHETDPRFQWQNKAADVAATMREPSVRQGAFIVDMASTGCGKTLANARIMYSLADPARGMRCAFAMGLRTLTLQTGKAFRGLLGLGDEDIAIRVGGSASRALFEHYEQSAEATGSASSQKLVEEDTHIRYDGDIDRHPLLRRAVADPDVRRLLVAPLLVCTIDHLTPATESQRGGRQIAPMLRLSSGDLVLDEPDDFDLSDLPALTRLVHWAGLLGARMLLSSATLPPALIEGLFEAYRNGRHHYNRNCGDRPGATAAPPSVCCAWVDEFHQQAQDCPDAEQFANAHAQFVKRRHGNLSELAAAPRRRAELLPLTGIAGLHGKDLPALARAFAAQVLAGALRLHDAHFNVDPISHKRVSFGLVRMANIEPLFEVALALFRQSLPVNTRVHLCVYHSRHPVLVRSAIEQQLDQALQRHDPDAVFSLPDIRQRIDANPETDQLFVVLGSPVTEVGRDHDYDWAVVEPSSMRSLIQLAGRVRRHRAGSVDSPNILVFSQNLRCLTNPGQAAYCKPGFESDRDAFRLTTHDLARLMSADELTVIDARPRIVSPAPAAMRPRERLVDLEHARIRSEMLPELQSAPASALGSRARATTSAATPTLNASTWWHEAPRDALLTAVLQREQRFRKEPVPRDITVALLPDEDGENGVLHQVLDGARRGSSVYVEVDGSQCRHLPNADVNGERIQPWGVVDYMTELKDLAAALELSLRACAERFGTATVRPNNNGWRYHPVLGFARRLD